MEKSEIEKITDYIFIDSFEQPADLAIIFGTRSAEPVAKVFSLYADGLVRKILLSGGVNKTTGKIEAEELAEQLIGLGVDPSDLILEKESTNSLENVLFSRRTIERELGFEKVKKVIAVVKHYHARRALMTLKKHFPSDCLLIPAAYDLYGFTKDDWWQHNLGREKVLGEWEKIPVYLAKGDIAEI